MRKVVAQRSNQMLPKSNNGIYYLVTVDVRDVVENFIFYVFNVWDTVDESWDCNYDFRRPSLDSKSNLLKSHMGTLSIKLDALNTIIGCPF